MSNGTEKPEISQEQQNAEIHRLKPHVTLEVVRAAFRAVARMRVEMLREQNELNRSGSWASGTAKLKRAMTALTRKKSTMRPDRFALMIELRPL